MQNIEWDDLAVFLDVARTGSLTAAATRSGTHASTAGRRLVRLEEALEATLFERTPRGLKLTPTGERALQAARDAEAAVQRFRAAVLADDRQVRGEVVLATSSILGRYLVVPALPALEARWPALTLRLVSRKEHDSLAAGELDLAFRLVPEGREVGTPGLIARRVTTESFFLYGRRDVVERAAIPSPVRSLEGARVVRYESPAWEPGARWFDSLDHAGTVTTIANEMPVVLGLVEAGLGLGVLPRFVARNHPDLVAVGEAVDACSLWIVFPPTHRRIARIRAVADWLEAAVQE